MMYQKNYLIIQIIFLSFNLNRNFLIDMENLITGGSGYVGSYLIPELLKESFSLKVLIYDQQKSQKIESGSISYVNGDLCDVSYDSIYCCVMQ